jgi:hypothetical protein
MPVIERSINLNVPADLAFRYLFDPTHLTEFCPSLIEVSNVQRHSVRSAQFEWTFKMIGVRFEGAAEITDTHHNEQLDLHFWGGIRGNLTWRLQPADEEIRLEAKVDYAVPPPLLHKHGENIIVQANEQAVECMLKSVKTLLASKAAVQPSG